MVSVFVSNHIKHTYTLRGPVQFFAVNLMKLIFANVIQRYDLRLIHGTNPSSILTGTMAILETLEFVLVYWKV
jgi:hypothetical protein